MANNYTSASMCVADLSDEAMEWIERQTTGDLAGDGMVLREYYITNGEGEDDCYVGFEVKVDRERREAYFYHDESILIDQLVFFLQKLLQTFYPDGMLSLEWAETCSKPRVGEFGGGAAVITAQRVISMTTGQWVSRTIKKLAEKNPSLKDLSGA